MLKPEPVVCVTYTRGLHYPINAIWGPFVPLNSPSFGVRFGLPLRPAIAPAGRLGERERQSVAFGSRLSVSAGAGRRGSPSRVSGAATRSAGAHGSRCGQRGTRTAQEAAAPREARPGRGGGGCCVEAGAPRGGCGLGGCEGLTLSEAVWLWGMKRDFHVRYIGVCTRSVHAPADTLNCGQSRAWVSRGGRHPQA